MYQPFVSSFLSFLSFLLVMITMDVVSADHHPRGVGGGAGTSTRPRRLSPKSKGKGKGAASTKAPTMSPTVTYCTPTDDVTIQFRFDADGCDDDATVFNLYEISYTGSGSPTYTLVETYANFADGITEEEIQVSRDGCYYVSSRTSAPPGCDDFDFCTSALITYDNGVYTFLDLESDLYGIYGEGCTTDLLLYMLDGL